VGWCGVSDRVPDPHDPQEDDIFVSKHTGHRIRIDDVSSHQVEVWYMDGAGVMLGGGAWGRHGWMPRERLARDYLPRLADIDPDEAVAELVADLDAFATEERAGE
jgi:hypothetical protein